MIIYLLKYIILTSKSISIHDKLYNKLFLNSDYVGKMAE